MAQTVGELLTSILADLGATQVFGVVGDALNPFTDAIRRDGRMSWLGVRHEEGAALAAAGQAKLTGRLGVCAGTTGPGATHLLAGLYEARHDHAPVLAIGGDVPTSMGGIDYLQAADHVAAFDHDIIRLRNGNPCKNKNSKQCTPNFFHNSLF